jgi:hypothetical protein
MSCSLKTRATNTLRGCKTLALALSVAHAGAVAASAQIVAPESSFGPFVEQTTLMPTGTTAVDGDTALVATPGVVYVFDRDPATDTWAEVTQLIPGDGGAGFGRTVAFDGTTAVVGAQGAAYVFRRGRRGAHVWREVTKLLPSDGHAGFGSSVDVDGTHLIVGAPGVFPNNPTGAAYVFRRDAPGPQGWTEVVTLSGTGPGFGAVSLSHETAVVASFAVSGIAANIFSRHHGGPDNWGLVKRIPEMGFLLSLGGAVEVSGDTLMIGTGEFFYAVRVYDRNQGGLNAWGLVKTYGPDEQLCCGTVGRIEISGDKAILAITGLGSEVHVLARNQGGPNAWGRVSRFLPTRIAPPDPRYPSVSLSEDTALIAATSMRPEQNAVLVLVSDLDGDTLRDGLDPCPKDPLNNVEGGCQRASWANPLLDDSIALMDFSTSSPLPRRTILTATYSNSSATSIRNPFFEVTAIGGGNTLINADAGPGGAGSTLSPDVGDGVLSPGETMQVQFVIRHPIGEPVELAVAFRGEPVP